ncbi:MAG: hypothetical protein LUD68_05355, partial [Rikenellaceae bacterium]|nr:hypothetical protein [Rikenellaceae bacterium]
SEIFRVRFSRLSIAATRFTHARAQTQRAPYSLLGVRLLRYGRVTVDYPKSRFYFEPFESGPIELAATQWNLGINVRDQALVAAVLWDELTEQLQPGDRIVSIDGQEIGQRDYCTTHLNGIRELEGKETARVTVDCQGTLKTILIHKR